MGVVEDNSKMPQDLHSDVPGEAIIRRRALLEKICGRVLHDDFAELQLRKTHHASASATAHALARAPISGAYFFFQSILLHKIVTQAEAAITTGVDLEFPGDRRKV